MWAVIRVKENFTENLAVKRVHGMWGRWQWLLGVVLSFVCLSCQPTMPPSPPPGPPPPRPQVTPEQPERPSFFVRVGRLNLRAGPGMDFPKIGLLERNEELEKVGEAEDWYQVRVKRSGTLGWVSSRYLSSTRVTVPLETAPEAPTTPTPEETPPSATKPPTPAKPETVVPRAPKPAEAAEPPAPQPSEEPAPAPSPGPEAVPEKPTPKIEEPPATPAPAPPEEKPKSIRIM